MPIINPIPIEPAVGLVTNIAYFPQYEVNGSMANGSLTVNGQKLYTAPTETEAILTIAAAARQMNLPVEIFVGGGFANAISF